MTTITNDAAKVADIIGELGLNIAEAQKELNAGYINSLLHVLNVAKTMKVSPANLVDVVASIAPPHYQYSRTTLEFAADMAQRKDSSFQVGGSIGFGAVALHGAYSSASGEDYRAATRITTQLEAVPSNQFGKDLVKNGSDNFTGDFTLPEATDADENLSKATSELIKGFKADVAGG